MRARGHRRRHRHLLGTASRWEAFKINSAIKEARRCQKDQPARRSVMKGHLTAFVLAGSLATATIATPTPAQARWGWGWGLGALALGAFVGAALARPAYAYGYYPAYSYGYPAYSYGTSLFVWLCLPSLFVWLCLPTLCVWRLLSRLPTLLPPRLVWRLSGRPTRCDPSRPLALRRPVGPRLKPARPGRARKIGRLGLHDLTR